MYVYTVVAVASVEAEIKGATKNRAGTVRHHL